MNEFLQQLREQLSRVWENLPPQQKVIFVAAPVILLISLGIAVYMASQPQYVNLVSTPDQAQLAQIRDFLETQNINYQIPDQNTIQVDQSVVHTVRFSLASEGLIGTQAGPGYELFNQVNLGMTDRMFDIQEKVALQNTLAKAIAEGDRSIESAIVNVVIPERELFREDQVEPTASVKVITRGRSVPNSVVEGIQNLVAASVPKLTPDRVTVVDSSNRVLSDNQAVDSMFKQTQKQLQIQQAIEAELRNDLEGLLTRAVGPDNYQIAVQATLDWEKRRTKQIEISTDSPANVSTKTYAEESSTQGIAGPPGPSSNVQDTGIGAEGDTTSTTIEEEIINNQFPWLEAITEEETGELKDLKISVMVDYIENEEGEMVPRPDEWVQQLEPTLRVAAGMPAQPQVGVPYELQLTQVAFDTSEIDRLVWEQRWNTITDIVRSVLPLLLLAILGFFAYLFFKRAFAPPDLEYEEEEEIPIEPVTDAKELTLSQLGLAEFGDIASLPAEEQRRVKMQEHVVNYAAEKPEEVAAILKAWLSS